MKSDEDAMLCYAMLCYTMLYYATLLLSSGKYILLFMNYLTMIMRFRLHAFYLHDKEIRLFTCNYT